MSDERLKALANDILEKCQKQGLTFHETALVLDIAKQRAYEGKERAMEDAGEYKLKFKPF